MVLKLYILPPPTGVAVNVVTPASVRTTKPQITGLGDWNRRQRRGGIFLRWIIQKEIIDLLGIEPRQAKIEVGRLEVVQLDSQEFLVPIGPRSRPVYHEAEGLDLRRRPLVAQDDWDIRNAQLASGFEAQMAVNHFAVTADQTRNFETEFTNTGAHAIYSNIVLARVARVKNQLVD
jgi:hypothetical protein